MTRTHPLEDKEVITEEEAKTSLLEGVSHLEEISHLEVVIETPAKKKIVGSKLDKGK